MRSDHYLYEDYNQVDEELKNIRNTFIEVLHGATEADFLQKEQQLGQLNHSMLILKALNSKKLERDRIEKQKYMNFASGRQ